MKSSGQRDSRWYLFYSCGHPLPQNKWTSIWLRPRPNRILRYYRRVAATITDNQALSRFELQLDGEVAFIDYRRAADHITLLHAEVPPHLSGKGIGTELARSTLDALRSEGARVRIRCSFVAAFAARHPEYQNILVD